MLASCAPWLSLLYERPYVTPQTRAVSPDPSGGTEDGDRQANGNSPHSQGTRLTYVRNYGHLSNCLKVSQNPAVRSTSITGGKTWPAADPVLKRSSSSPLVVAAQRDLTQTLPTKPSFATPVYTRDTDAWDTPPSRSYHSLSEPVAPSSLVTTVYNDTVSTGSHLRAFATLSAVSASHLSVPELAWPSQLPVYTPDYSQSHLYSSTLVTAVRVASSDANSLCNYDKVPDLNLGCIPSCDSGIFLTA
jgi:hypothetical protein